MLRDRGKFCKPVTVLPASTIGGWLGVGDVKLGGVGPPPKGGGVGGAAVGVGTIEGLGLGLAVVPVVGVGLGLVPGTCTGNGSVIVPGL